MQIKNFPGWLADSFKTAVSFSDPYARRRGLPLATLAWSYAVLVFVSFGMLWLGDKLNASDMAVTRFMAKAHATMTAQLQYKSAARDQITVVMYDQQYLRDTESAWPISYQAHADWLLRLAGDPAARPKAIMLDITFGQDRDDPTLPALQQALCKIQNEFKVPVFLAALPSPQTGKLTVRSGLGPGTASAAPRCFTLVGVDYVPDELDGLAWDYRLTRHRSAAGWEDGPGDETEGESQPSYRSAAMTIAQDVAHLHLGEEDAPLALVWGIKSAPQGDRPESLSHCKPGAYDAMRYVPGVLRQTWEKPSAPVCPYHRTLSMAQLGELPEEALVPYLAGRYVMVGANVPAYNDFANSPIHGVIPGVYLHAMALDNLLTYGDRYKQSNGWNLPPPINLVIPGLLAVFAVFLVHVFWWRLAPERWLFGKDKEFARDSSKSAVRTRGLHAFGKALAWLARLSLQTTVAMVLICLLQSWFRIGMLPVVELVTMTLLAEGVDYMEKLRWLFHGDLEEPVTPEAKSSPGI